MTYAHKVHLDQRTRKGRRAIGRAIRRDGFAYVGTLDLNPQGETVSYRATVRRITGSRRRRGLSSRYAGGTYSFRLNVLGQQWPAWGYDFHGGAVRAQGTRKTGYWPRVPAGEGEQAE